MAHRENGLTRQLSPTVSVALLEVFQVTLDYFPFRNTEAYKTKHVHNHDDATTEWLADALEHPDRRGISLLMHVLDPIALHLFMSRERCCVLVSLPIAHRQQISPVSR